MSPYQRVTAVIPIRQAAPRLAPFLAIALLTVACQSTANEQGAATGANVTQVANELQAGIGHLDAAMAALTSLVNEPAADLSPQYDAFSDHLGQLEATSKKLRESTAGMQEKGKAYFTDWDARIAAIQNEDLREESADRRKAVEKEFTAIREDYTEARESFDPLLADLIDIRTALGTDLTLEGLDAVKKIVGKVNGRAKDCKEDLQDLADSFREVGVKMSTSGPTPPDAETK